MANAQLTTPGPDIHPLSLHRAAYDCCHLWRDYHPYSYLVEMLLARFYYLSNSQYAILHIITQMTNRFRQQTTCEHSFLTLTPLLHFQL